MKKSLFLFALLLIGTLTTSAIFKDRIHGKWFVEYVKLDGEDEEFDDESNAPWMEFKDDNVLLLGDPGSNKAQRTTWSYDKGLGIVHLSAFGEELDFKTTKLTESTCVMKAHDGETNKVILKLKRHL